MPFRMGPLELIILLVVVMMVFGVGKLPQVGHAIGQTFKEFRKGQAEVEEILSTDISPDKTERQGEQG